ncbi:glutaminase A [Reichenbachiella carrageenanivorans]|uniref:Glutaminase n=1 Tax=Reichenbachiella carrageenanivorans TaxID=2979869 RepID=A0ABY6CXZ6_9BACT|nr:glutaminase A [Reichenbachiella carrageenanivorans]UXX78786.1 glutaminase A [Reichenbachiella carrageenanivorans]
MKMVIIKNHLSLSKQLSYGLVFMALAMLHWSAIAQVKKGPDPLTLQEKRIKDILKEAYDKYKNDQSGTNADYIPELAKVDPELFGIVVVTVGGKRYGVGDIDYTFSIQSISKVFTLAHVLQEMGSEAILDKLGAEATGMPFNSVMAVELQPGRVGNPFVNAGAMATTSLVSGKDQTEKWDRIQAYYSDFAGEPLAVITSVYKSESKTNQHNQAMAKLLASYGKMYDEPATVVDRYTKQCAIGVNTKQLAVMGATLAAGGVNPYTGKQLLSPEEIPKILSLMLTAGLYDYSGTWSYRTGLPAKSGVGGGILAVIPGKGAIAAFSPRLDQAGNSVRAQKAIAHISKELGANIFFRNFQNKD